MAKKVGHLFLAELGKKRLRPGGIEATNWLMEQGQFTAEKKVLEVACNMGTTLIEVAQEYQCQITGVDIDREALEKAQQNINHAGLQKIVKVQTGNALKLPFEDNTFDIVINEAMLTMLDDRSKHKALNEYYRVLKPGGKLLTHDISLTDHVESQLSQTIKMKVAPLTVEDWLTHYQSVGFKKTDQRTGKMSLMSPIGLIRDEGFIGAVRIIKNGLKTENRKQFLSMSRFFRHQQKNLRYIVNCAEK
ncbi:hypothetical protein IGI39_004609 [Enterococcus sp. AZ135]|uniref:class I SAM-dependent methyltransferase n=1 Tax=unclassified Enterococcus TaxID=2608891 RepID=UPI003F1EF8C8